MSSISNLRLLTNCTNKTIQQILSNQVCFPMRVYDTYEDEKLVCKSQEGDRKAFTELYNRHWAILFLQINKIVQNDEESIDIVHNIFEKLWKNFPGNIKNFKAYLYQMGRYASINYINSSNRKSLFLANLYDFSEKSSSGLAEKIQYSEILNLLHQEIANLPPKSREIFIRARINEESYKDIANDLDLSLQTIKTTVFRITKSLRKKIPYIKLFFLN